MSKSDKEREDQQPPEEEPVEETAEEQADVPAEPTPEPEEDFREKYLRTLAEFDNFRKRGDRERIQARQYAIEGLSRSLLTVLDSLEFAQNAEGDLASIREGIGLALQDALRVLGDKGVTPIKAVGQTFDPRFHEAVGVLPADDDHPAGTIVTEMCRGYMLHDRVLRASKVHIAMQPPPSKKDKKKRKKD